MVEIRTLTETICTGRHELHPENEDRVKHDEG